MLIGDNWINKYKYICLFLKSNTNKNYWIKRSFMICSKI